MTTLIQGSIPLLISLPHNSSFIPEALRDRMTLSAQSAPDTDWFVDQLYDFARDWGASILIPSYSRYVVDLNRPASDESLYPGQNTTGLCPTVQFTGEPVYQAGREPSFDEIRLRVEQYWEPYHAALRQELERLRNEFGRVVLWEGHSIKGDDLPYLFEGRLPDLNIGTAGGISCRPETQVRLQAALEDQDRFDWVINGRFQGGYNTRHYHDVANGIETIQLEMAQRTYMDEQRLAFHQEKAEQAQVVIAALLHAALS